MNGHVPGHVRGHVPGHVRACAGMCGHVPPRPLSYPPKGAFTVGFEQLRCVFEQSVDRDTIYEDDIIIRLTRVNGGFSKQLNTALRQQINANGIFCGGLA